MANEEHVRILEQGLKPWNDWREITYGKIEPDLSGIDLEGAELPEVNFRYTNLSGANLEGANLNHALMVRVNLSSANLVDTSLGSAELVQANLQNARANGAIFSLSSLFYADFTGAEIASANLKDTFLKGARFNNAELNGASFDASGIDHTDFSNSQMIFTSFGHVDLSTAIGLETVRHHGPSFIGIDTLFMSKGEIPEVFLKGCGVPESFIVQIPSLVTSVGPIQFYKCFISFAEADDKIAETLYNDLRKAGITCWRWKEDAKWGKTLMRSIDEAILLYDKLIVICSRQSLQSPAVIREIERALQKEDDLSRQGKDSEVLFPIRLDNYVFDGWNHHRKADVIAKHIGDFSDWRSAGSYDKALARLVADLKA